MFNFVYAKSYDVYVPDLHAITGVETFTDAHPGSQRPLLIGIVSHSVLPIAMEEGWRTRY
ncbi:MAG: hypothetical protein ABEL04_10185 [Salinibacter sp.]|uniref:hypothetical protein n=1 Tax=Salinibacter sp. TaxID=2065818 RepID=UPI0035D463F4